MLLCLPALAPHSFEVTSIQPVFTKHLWELGVICGRCVSLCTWLQGVRPILGSDISRTDLEFLGRAGKSVVWVWSRAPWVTVPALPQMSCLNLSKSLRLSGPQLTHPAYSGRAHTMPRSKMRLCKNPHKHSHFGMESLILFFVFIQSRYFYIVY